MDEQPIRQEPPTDNKMPKPDPGPIKSAMNKKDMMIKVGILLLVIFSVSGALYLVIGRESTSDAPSTLGYETDMRTYFSKQKGRFDPNCSDIKKDPSVDESLFMAGHAGQEHSNGSKEQKMRQLRHYEKEATSI